MRLVLLTSNHVRHMAFAARLSTQHDLALIIAEEKGNSAQMTGENADETRLLQSHFASRALEETKYFGCLENFPNTTSHVEHVERGGLNTDSIKMLIQEYSPEGIAVFGCGLVCDEILEIAPKRVINVHQGLSPYYRGSGTNFWPFVHSALQFVGVTVHYVDSGIDTGGIIAHGRPAIELADSLHSIGCKVVDVSARMVSEVFDLFENGYNLPPIQQWEKGRLYQRKHFNAAAVRRAQRNIADGLIEQYVGQVADGKVMSVRVIELS